MDNPEKPATIFDYTNYSYIWFQQIFQNCDLLLG